MKNDDTLTEKELAQLNRFRKGMDEPNTGWLHEMEVYNGLTLSGVMASLVKKGCITSSEEKDPGQESCYWVQVKKDWQA